MAGAAAVVAPVIAGAPAFDKDIPIFDPYHRREGKTVALVFDSDEERVKVGSNMFLNGEVDQLVLLSTIEPELAQKYLGGSDERLKDVPVFHDPLNTSEEAIAAMNWLKSGDFRNVVIVGKDWHIQRCAALLAPIANNYVITQAPSAAPTSDQYLYGERVKLGMTRIGAVTRIPRYQIPYI